MAKRLLLLAGTLLVMCVVAEIGLSFVRTFEPFPRYYVGERENVASSNFMVDPATGWKVLPNHEFRWVNSEFQATYRSNRQGFRADADFDPSETRAKIVLTGDSFTFGIGVEFRETFGARIDAELPGSVVYNLAMPGFGVDQMWLSVRHQGLPLEPDLVVVCLCDADFKRSLSAFRPEERMNKPLLKLVDGRLVPQTPADRPGAFVHFLEHNSRLWMAGRLVKRWIGYRTPFGQWWRLNEALLDAIRADCRERRTPVLFVYIPTRAQRKFDTLRSYMDEHGAHFIDPTQLPSMSADLYYPVDGHFNAEGHALLAGAILDWIRGNMPELAGAPGAESSGD